MSLTNTKKSDQLYLTILILPLWTLFLSFKKFRLPQAKNLFWLFCIFLGMIHIYFPEEDSSADGTRYAKRLIELNQNPVTLENFTSSFYEDGEFTDIYQPTITYLLSLVTGNPRWLFFVFAIVFGFFYSRNIWFVLDKFPKTISFPLILLTLYYILICPIWNINGVRMWTALHVFVYGALPYLYNSNRSKLIWCLASIFIHFAFFFPVIILLAYYFIPKSINFLLTFYIISFFIKEIDFELIRNFLSSYTPSFLSFKVNSYINQEYAQQVIEAKKDVNFYIIASEILVRWTTTILLFVSCIWGKKIIKADKALYNFICFSLFIYSILNIFSSIPSINRFFTLSQIFAFTSVILFYILFKENNYKQSGISIIFKFVPILLLLPIIISLRIGTDYYGVSLFFNPIAAYFIDDTQPIIHFVKSIF